MQNRIAFPGVPGCYSHLAAESHLPGLRGLASRDFLAVAHALRSGKAAFGILPVENSIVGEITEARELLRSATDFEQIDELSFVVTHCLLGLPGADIHSLAWVESHPAALAQCADWLSARQLRPRAVQDTAGAARDIAVDRDYTRGAIASADAAERYGLVIMARDIADAPGNATRFAIITRKGTAA